MLMIDMNMPKSCPCELATEIEGNFYPCFAHYGVVSRTKEFDYCVANVTRPDWCPIKREVVHSRWVYNEGDYVPYCENCLMPSDTETKYCASCGAIMDGEQDV